MLNLQSDSQKTGSCSSRRSNLGDERVRGYRLSSLETCISLFLGSPTLNALEPTAFFVWPFTPRNIFCTRTRSDLRNSRPGCQRPRVTKTLHQLRFQHKSFGMIWVKECYR